MHTQFFNPGPKELETIGEVMQSAIRSAQSCFVLKVPVVNGCAIGAAYDCKINLLGSTQFLCPGHDSCEFNMNHGPKAWAVEALATLGSHAAMMVTKDTATLKVSGRVLHAVPPDWNIAPTFYPECRWVLDTSTKQWRFLPR